MRRAAEYEAGHFGDNIYIYAVIIDSVSYEFSLRSLARTFVLFSQSLVFIAVHNA